MGLRSSGTFMPGGGSERKNLKRILNYRFSVVALSNNIVKHMVFRSRAKMTRIIEDDFKIKTNFFKKHA